MKQTFNITIPAPCTEKWADMKPIGTSRYCDTCQRCLTDFSTMSDEAILTHLRKANGKVCGRFAPHQLNRPLLAAKVPRSRRFVASILALSSFAVAANSQSIPATQEIVERSGGQPVDNAETAAKIASDSTVIFRGTILDASDNTPLIGATISWSDGKHGVITDITGAFKIKIEASKLPLNGKAKVSYTGYLPKEIALTEASFSGPVSIVMEPNEEGKVYIMGGIVAYNYLNDDIAKSKPSFWQRLKNVFR